VLIEDEAYAWLRPLAALIVQMDEEPESAAAIVEARALVKPDFAGRPAMRTIAQMVGTAWGPGPDWWRRRTPRRGRRGADGADRPGHRGRAGSTVANRVEVAATAAGVWSRWRRPADRLPFEDAAFDVAIVPMATVESLGAPCGRLARHPDRRRRWSWPLRVERRSSPSWGTQFRAARLGERGGSPSTNPPSGQPKSRVI
jgi:hypothetical protein